MAELFSCWHHKQISIRLQFLGINKCLFQRDIHIKLMPINPYPPLKQCTGPPLTGRGNRQLGMVCREGVPEKVHMYKSVAGTDSTLGRIDEKLGQQVNCVRRSVRKKLLEWYRSELGERDLVVVWEGGHAGPDGLIRGAELAEDADQLLNITLTREERRVVEKFTEDTADGPQVDAFIIAASSIQQLRCSVPRHRINTFHYCIPLLLLPLVNTFPLSCLQKIRGLSKFQDSQNVFQDSVVAHQY